MVKICAFMVKTNIDYLRYRSKYKFLILPDKHDATEAFIWFIVSYANQIEMDQ